MLDLGLTKLALIGVVALVVIGPERLPKVARTLGSLYGRAQRYISDVKSEVSREIELEELRKMQKDVQDAAHSVKSSFSELSTELTETEREIQSAWTDDPPPLPPHMTGLIARKSKDFRRKKLARTSALPAWYKNRNGTKMHVMSGAARVAKFRPGGKSPHSFY